MERLVRVTLMSLTLLASAASPSNSEGSSTPLSMARIPPQKVRLGLSLDELILVSERCAQSLPRGQSPDLCLPDNFSAELRTSHVVSIETFFLDKEEVSQGAYERCVLARRCRALDVRLAPPLFFAAELPAVLVSAQDAERYCKFRGARLPSEAEWELAAKGLTSRQFPWGEVSSPLRANVGSFDLAKTDAHDGFEWLAPTDAFPLGRASTGVLNLSGNVEEWTSSPFATGLVTVRGGSFAQPAILSRTTARRGVPPGTRSVTIGFRCAVSPRHA